MSSKKTVVLGASTNPARYSNTAVHNLTTNGHEVVPVGIKKGSIAGIDIQNGRPEVAGVDTITLYLNPTRQKDYYDYILSLQPKRIIFNPGTENPELVQLAKAKGIEVEIACTLVMLSVGTY
ncbi:MAG: CoA-binding protein [Bacteroidota bacterium]